MKKLLTLVLFLVCHTPNIHAQKQSGFEKHVQDIDTTIRTLYNVISGEKGETRNWELFKYLFHPNAKLIPTGKNLDGLTNVKFMTPDDYINTSGKWLFDNGFHENEISKKIEIFGPITHVFSTYESFRSKSDERPFMRGINSIQLLYDGNRYWIINIYWASETKENPIPNNYLK